MHCFLRKQIIVLFSIISLVLVNGCTSAETGDGDKTWKSSALGTAAGALAGAAIGAATGNWKKGMAIGAAAGLAVGATTGVVLDRQEEKLRKAGVRTQRDESGRLLVSLTGNALKFESGSTTLSAEGKEQLKKVSDILKEYTENRVAIQVHTDSQGDDQANMNLSAGRALAVENTLRAYGIPAPCIVEVKGYGEGFPVADNNTAEGRATNRRVDLVISADEAEAAKNQKTREKYKKS